MAIILDLFGNLWQLLAVLVGAISVGALLFAALQFITAQGDPQKIATARMSIIGSVLGLIVVGLAFVVPGLISDEVVEEAAGISIVDQAAGSCDRILQSQLVTQTAASTADRMNAVIRRIQLRGGDCANDVWAPVVGEAKAAAGNGTGGIGCITADVLGGIAIPSTIREGATATIRKKPGRDANGNIAVHFDQAKRPGDNAVCWLYNASVGSWLTSQTDGDS